MKEISEILVKKSTFYSESAVDIGNLKYVQPRRFCIAHV